MNLQWKLYSLVFSLLLGFVPSTPAAAQTYATIDYPGACKTIATAINATGAIVGDFAPTCKTPETVHGYLLSQGTFAQFDFPSSTMTRPLGIDDFGDIVGYYRNSKQGKDRGFLLSGGTYTAIDVPGASQTHAIGIDSTGTIFGSYCMGGNSCYPTKSLHGFMLSGGLFTTIDFPGALSTELWSRDRAGRIAGRYQDASSLFHIFLLSDGNFTTLDYPGAVETAPGAYTFTGGFNVNGDIASTYCTAEPCLNPAPADHGFLLSGGVYTTIDFPGAAVTIAAGINSSFEVVGGFIDSSGGINGFLRVP